MIKVNSFSQVLSKNFGIYLFIICSVLLTVQVLFKIIISIDREAWSLIFIDYFNTQKTVRTNQDKEKLLDHS